MTFSKVNHKSALNIILYVTAGLLFILIVSSQIYTRSLAIFFYYLPFLFLFLKSSPFTKIEIDTISIKEKGLFRLKRIVWTDVRQVSLVKSRRSDSYFTSEKEVDDSFLYDGVSICILKERSPDPPAVFWKNADYITFQFRPEAWAFIKEILARNNQSGLIIYPSSPKKR